MEEVIRAIDCAISHYIADKKITRDQMAELLGMSANTLRWKREGKNEWLLSEVLKLSDLMGVSLDELTEFKVFAV